MIVFMFTGGTISMRADPANGAPVPTLRGAQLLSSVPGIERTAPLEVDEWATMPGAHLTVDQLWALRSRIAHHIARPDVDAVIVAQGTDTLEESAYLTARSLATPKPIIFTGAMRTADELSWDGPANLLAAVRVAASPAARGHGVLVVFAGQIFSAADVTKVHTHLLQAFGSPGLGPLGIVDGESVRFYRSVEGGAPVLTPPHLASPVDIVYVYAGADGRLLDAARETGVGVVLAALGRGNSNPPIFAAVQRWLAAGRPVVVTSRIHHGRVGPTYGFPGGGRSLHDAGAIFAGAVRAQQARIDLMLALGAGLHGAELAAVFGG
jgi:L-asparaginase